MYVMHERGSGQKTETQSKQETPNVADCPISLAKAFVLAFNLRRRARKIEDFKHVSMLMEQLRLKR